MSKYLSSTKRNLTVGIEDYTNFETVLTVIGNTNIKGDLFVDGGKFLVEAESFTIRDPLIELGLIKDPVSGEYVPPTTDLGNDVGVVLNYFNNTTQSADAAAMYFDNDASRMKLLSEATVSGNNIISNAYAALEIGALWLNDCAGESQVINCVDGERLLENISIDCGVYV